MTAAKSKEFVRNWADSIFGWIAGIAIIVALIAWMSVKGNTIDQHTETLKQQQSKLQIHDQQFSDLSEKLTEIRTDLKFLRQAVERDQGLAASR